MNVNEVYIIPATAIINHTSADHLLQEDFKAQLITHPPLVQCVYVYQELMSGKAVKEGVTAVPCKSKYFYFGLRLLYVLWFVTSHPSETKKK